MAIGGYSLWRDEQSYEAGHSAYLAGDCAGALPSLREAVGDEPPSSSDSDTQVKARAELEECEALLAAEDLATAGNVSESVLAYSAFLVSYPRSPLVSIARSEAQSAIGNATRAVAEPGLCDSLETLEGQDLLPTGDPLGELLYACGLAYEDAEEWTAALEIYSRFRSEFGDHPLASDVETAYARATLAEAAAAGAGTLPAPEAGRVGGIAGQATVLVINDAPESLSLVFSGPEVQVEEMALCASCVTFSGEGPDECPGKGPTAEYHLAPGTYDVVVRAGGLFTTPFRGSWTLKAKRVYEYCFYLVSQ